MIDGEDAISEKYANWTANDEAGPEEDRGTETGLAANLVHRYFYNNQTRLLDDIAPEQRVQVISDMLQVPDGTTTVLDCCLKYIKDPAEQTRLAFLLYKNDALVYAIRNKELENVQVEIIAALLIRSGKAMLASEYFAYKEIDHNMVCKIVKEELAGDPIIVFNALKVLRAAGNFYDEENQNPNYENFENQIKEFLQACRLDPEKTLSLWSNNAALFNPNGNGIEQLNEKSLALEHISTLMALESAQNGNAKFLQDRYGIENFGRYGAKVLLKQIEQTDDVDSRYGIAVFPKNDYNGAFGNDIYGGKPYQKMLGFVQSELEPLNSVLRIYEVKQKTEFYHKVMQAKKTYESTAGKIQFALLAGHGTWNDIQLGNDREGDKNSMITYADLLMLNSPYRSTELQNIAFSKFKDCFQDDADLILHSCSTGAGADNIALLSSEVSQFTVAAPEEPAGASNLFVSEKDGRIHLSSYYGSSKKRYKKGVDIGEGTAA